MGASDLQPVLGVSGQVALYEEIVASAAVVVGGEQGISLIQFTDGVESPG